jgi:2-oxoglutarate ferredoxin oxidoreductase subunit alpha
MAGGRYEELDIMIGGPQGSGLETTAQILTSSLAYMGYGVFSDREYYSNITGKHSYIHMKISSKIIPYYLTYPVRLLAAMDEETLFMHFQDIYDEGYVVYDSYILKKKLDTIVTMENYTKNRVKKILQELGIGDDVESLIKYMADERRIIGIEIDFRSYLNRLASRYSIAASQVSRYMSSIPIAVLGGLMDIDREAVEGGLRRRFYKREKLIEHNLYLYDIIREEIVTKYGSPLKMDKSKLDNREFLVVSGNDIVALAKMVGGLRYQSYYPITPAGDECFVIETHENLKNDGLSSIIVFQTEDEISAITSAIGAALTGVRSSTATSGPGFSLMVEGLSWAGNSEVPIVITYYQRGGPATGLPTRGAQSDLLFTIFAGHGEFPRIVLASGDHMEAFQDTILAFNLAEKYQVPVIHLLDKFIANTFVTMELPDIEKIKIERGEVYMGNDGYKRFDLNKIISPRAALGTDVVMWHTGNEHDEYGHTVEDPILRTLMYEKRMKKMDIMDKEIPESIRVTYYNHDDADLLLVGWGYVKNTVLQVLDLLESEGIKAAYLHLRMFSPFPTKYVEEILNRYDRDSVIGIEHDYLVQASKVITLNTGVRIDRSIIKLSGRPMYTNEVFEGVLDIVNNNRRRVVLTYGS